ncbi:MAG: phosphoglucosamine mutase, partial [Actinomycetes bacterium]
ARTGRTLADLASVVHKLPQVLINVSGVDRAGVSTNAELQSAVQTASERLGDSGRVLLRPSGTEQLVRVMVEAQTEAEAHEVADGLAEVVRATLSTP